MSIGSAFYKYRLYTLIALLVAVVVAGAWQLALADGQLIFLSNAEVVATLDGRPIAFEHAGRRWRSPVGRGDHELKVHVPGRDWSTIPLHVRNGLDQLAVPADNTQCFVVCDRRFGKVQVLSRSTPGQALPFGQGLALGVDDLQAHPNAEMVLIDLDCADLSLGNDEALNRVLR